MADFPNVTSPRELMQLFEEYGLQPHKRLGQNFLIDANIVRKIVEALEVEADDLVFEIGPGAGALTTELAKSGAQLVAIELDRGLCGLLGNLFEKWPNVKLINKDVLKLNWESLFAEFCKGGQTVKLISNLPYVISGPFVYAILKSSFPFQRAIIMLQKEVAHRLVTAPGESDYGALSVLCQYYTDGEILFNVSKNVFWPRPGVSSAVLKLKPGERLLGVEEEMVLWDLVQGAFQQRRKTLLNNMNRIYPSLKNKLPEILEEAAIKEQARPEDLSSGQFAMLARITYNYLK